MSFTSWIRCLNPYDNQTLARHPARRKSRPGRCHRPCSVEQLEDRMLPSFIGSYRVSDGPFWGTNPRCYSAREAAALVFGGVFSDYAISTTLTSVNHTGWYDGWADPNHIFQEDFKRQTGSGYNDPVRSGIAQLRHGWSGQFEDYP